MAHSKVGNSSRGAVPYGSALVLAGRRCVASRQDIDENNAVYQRGNAEVGEVDAAKSCPYLATNIRALLPTTVNCSQNPSSTNTFDALNSAMDFDSILLESGGTQVDLLMLSLAANRTKVTFLPILGFINSILRALMLKKAGGWTKQKFEIAKMAGYPEGGLGREVKAVVEGPYCVSLLDVCLCGWGADIFLGSPQRTVLSSFSGVVLVAGSSGIMFTLAALEDLAQKDTARRESRQDHRARLGRCRSWYVPPNLFLSLLSQKYLSITRSQMLVDLLHFLDYQQTTRRKRAYQWFEAR